VDSEILPHQHRASFLGTHEVSVVGTRQPLLFLL